ncbi:MAG TPA: CdaR family protein [Thermoanaerobaculia bacterium]|jgi:YbbR domain-containing protein|nr:CdaR family protein [Thermoanaerobaculia bacterium]
MSDRARLWGLRLLALLIALSIWYRVSLEDRENLTERTIEASVTYNRPVGYIVLDQVRSVDVRVRGTSKRIREITPYQVDVQVELVQAQKGAIDVPLEPENVKVPEGFEVVSIDPNVIRVELDLEKSQSLPVAPQIVGRVPAGYRAEEPEVFPNQVMVTGPESLITRVQALGTRAVSLTGRTETFEDSVAVTAPDPLIQVVQPARVSVRVPIQPVEAAKPDGHAEEKKKGS